MARTCTHLCLGIDQKLSLQAMCVYVITTYDHSSESVGSSHNPPGLSTDCTQFCETCQHKRSRAKPGHVTVLTCHSTPRSIPPGPMGSSHGSAEPDLLCTPPGGHTRDMHTSVSQRNTLSTDKCTAAIREYLALLFTVCERMPITAGYHDGLKRRGGEAGFDKYDFANKMHKRHVSPVGF